MTDELRFLGRGAGFNVREGNTAAFLRRGDEMLLIDCGETVFQRLSEGHWLDGVREVRVAVTHLHSDHCGSLGTLGLYLYFTAGCGMKLVVPPDDGFQNDLRSLLRLYGLPDGAWTMLPDSGFGTFAGVRALRFVPTRHAPTMTCFSLQWEGARGAVFYSADTCEGEPLARFLREHGDFDRVYMDATDLDLPDGVHLPVQKTARIVPRDLRSRVFLMHLNGESCETLGRELGFGIVENV